MAAARDRDGVDGGPPPSAEARDRLFLQILREAAVAFAEEIVEDARSLDVAMVLGSGFPALLFGPLRQIDRMGIDAMTGRLTQLEQRFGPRFAPGEVLLAAARERRVYYDDENQVRS